MSSDDPRGPSARTAQDAASPVVDPILEAIDPDRGRPADVMEARKLCLSFGPKPILTDVDMRFARGTITALIGPTGSGKSTFLRTLNRMNDKVPGFRHDGDVTCSTARASGRPARTCSPCAAGSGMLFQRPNPFPMSIRDNVVAGVKAHRIAKGKQLDVVAEQRLTEVGLWDAVKDRLGDSPFRLSGGQQQLLCLARALAVGPEVLLLDEPTSALDPISTEYVEALLRELAPALTLIVVTHNLAQARRVSDTHDVLLRRRAWWSTAPPTELFERPARARDRAVRHRPHGLSGRRPRTWRRPAISKPGPAATDPTAGRMDNPNHKEEHP